MSEKPTESVNRVDCDLHVPLRFSHRLPVRFWVVNGFFRYNNAHFASHLSASILALEGEFREAKARKTFGTKRRRLSQFDFLGKHED